MNTVIFRVDAYKEIGYGHLIRSLALAEEFKRQNDKVIFALNVDKFCLRLVGDYQIETVIMKNKAGNEKDIEDVLSLLNKYESPLFIHDNYFIDFEYETSIDNTKRIIAFDDIADRVFSSDVIINQNYGAEKLDYKVVNSHVKFLCGHKYVVLRDEILQNRNIREIKDVENILILFGGTDNSGLSFKVLQWMSKYIKCNVVFNILINKTHADVKKLYELKFIDKRIKIWHNIKNMGRFINKMDLAITAAGSIVWELLYIGVPTVSFVLADNQLYIAKNLNDDNYIISLGSFSDNKRDVFIETLLDLINDRDKRKFMIKKGQSLIDGFGKKRIREYLL